LPGFELERPDGSAREQEDNMFKHLLLPTDGSPLSNSAIEKGIQIARDTRAQVTGIYVAPEFHVMTYRTEMLEDTRSQFAADSRAHAKQYLEVIQAAAMKAGVICDVVTVTGDHPFEEIIKTAEAKGCDLIIMASHGSRGMRGLLLGSETQKVLTHGKVPVLVYR
jgi:nucleotide-binding universal stress UspA family protein